jgi:hypothetical protein
MGIMGKKKKMGVSCKTEREQHFVFETPPNHRMKKYTE